MAQGKFKAPKTQVPGKKKHNRPKGVTRKGKLDIAPKKKRLQDAGKLKKDLEKSIRSHIQEELTNKTNSLEPRSLKMLSSSSSSSSASTSSASSSSKKNKK